MSKAITRVSTWIAPRTVFTVVALQLILWALLEVLGQVSGSSHWAAKAGIRLTGAVTAYALAAWLNVGVAGEYRNAFWLRVAWMALALNAMIFFFRPFVESPLALRISPDEITRPLLGLWLHLLIIPANICFLVGVLSMWRAYHKVGLGFRIEVRDYVAMTGVLLIFLSLYFFRANLTEAQSPYLTSRILQPVGLVLLANCTAVSLVLHRLAVQMGGGQLAWALRWLTIYVLLRGVLVLLNAAKPELSSLGGSEFVRIFAEAGWQLIPWLAALAAVSRAELTVRAARELEQRRAAKDELVTA